MLSHYTRHRHMVDRHRKEGASDTAVTDASYESHQHHKCGQELLCYNHYAGEQQLCYLHGQRRTESQRKARSEERRTAYERSG